MELCLNILTFYDYLNLEKIQNTFRSLRKGTNWEFTGWFLLLVLGSFLYKPSPDSWGNPLHSQLPGKCRHLRAWESLQRLHLLPSTSSFSQPETHPPLRSPPPVCPDVSCLPEKRGEKRADSEPGSFIFFFNKMNKV